MVARFEVGETVFLGPTTIDLPVTPVPGSVATSGKQLAEIGLVAGGGTANGAAAALTAGMSGIVVLPITGADHAGNLLSQLLDASFSDVRRVASASRTRVSVIVPSCSDGPATITFTTRPVLDEALTIAAAESFLLPGTRLVLASFTNRDAGLVRRLIESHPGPVCLLPTADQCANRATTIPLLAKCDLVWLNADEIRLLTGRGLSAGIKFLRTQGVRSIVVTDGPCGVLACIDGRWWRVPAFDVQHVNGTSRCGDYAFGTYLAGMQRGEPINVALRAAMAAAAMHLADMPKNGWASIAEFAGKAAPLRPAPTRYHTIKKQSAPIEKPSLHRWRHSMMYMASGVGLALVVLGLIG
ncbi:MAG: carbohydrate kinase family protein [Planctomycetaceae bacterium]